MNPSDDSSSMNAPPSRVDASHFRGLPRRGRRKSIGDCSPRLPRRTSDNDYLPAAPPKPTTLGRSKSLDFPTGMIRSMNVGARKIPSRTKSLDFEEEVMRSINRRRMEKKLHLADCVTRLGTSINTTSRSSSTSTSRKGTLTDIAKPTGKHSRSKSGGLEELLRSPDLFSVTEGPDDEENDEEQDTPNVIVFRRRRPSMRASTWLD
mgnify:CR=1 FL=1